jgi:type I restriction enzyme S subunit
MTSEWPQKQLSEVVDFNPRLDKSAYRDDLEVSFVPMAAVEAGSGRMEVSQARRFATVKKGYTPFREGDVLFAKITPCMENGKMAVVPKLSNGLGFGSTEFHVLRPHQGIDPRYVYYFVSSQGFRREAAHRMTGAVGQKRVPKSFLEEASIPVPHFDDQQRIVAEIEKQFSRLDEAVANLKRVKANLKRYKAAVLKAAVEGKLTEDWRMQYPDVEPASELLKRILAARRGKWEADELVKVKAQGEKPKKEKWKENYKRPADYLGEDLPELPANWIWSSLESIADVIDPNPSHRMPKYVENGTPFISSENFIAQDGIDFSVGKQVSNKTLEEQKERFAIEEGDFALSRIGTIGKTRFLPVGPVYCLSHALVIIKAISSEIDRRFLRYVIASDATIEQAKLGVQSVGVPDLGMAKIRSFRIPLTCLREQNVIVELIEARMTVIREVERQVEASLKRADRLRQATLQKAFSRKLLFNGACR